MFSLSSYLYNKFRNVIVNIFSLFFLGTWISVFLMTIVGVLYACIPLKAKKTVDGEVYQLQNILFAVQIIFVMITF